MKKILVTGGPTTLISCVVLKLLDSSFEVVVVDNLSYGFEHLIDKRAIFEKADIGNRNKISEIIDKY